MAHCVHSQHTTVWQTVHMANFVAHATTGCIVMAACQFPKLKVRQLTYSTALSSTALEASASGTAAPRSNGLRLSLSLHISLSLFEVALH